MRNRWQVMRNATLAWAVVLAAATAAAGQATPAPLTLQTPPTAQPVVPAVEALTFEEAVRRAIEQNPDVRQAATAILRAEALLQQARAATRPFAGASVTTTILDAERGFSGNIVQPQTQTGFAAAVGTPVIAAAAWAARTQAADQVEVARLSVEETRRQVAIGAAQTYLAVFNEKRQLEVNVRARDTAQAQFDYARQRREAGAGSRLNELRAQEEVATSDVLVERSSLAVRLAQEALGLLLAADRPLDAASEPAFEVPAVAGETWLAERRDIRLFTAQREAADRVVRDSWRDWVPTVDAQFNPQYITPAGLFQPSGTWRVVIAGNIPVLDGGFRRGLRRQREAALESARVTVDDAALRARSEVRQAQVALEHFDRGLEKSRTAAQISGEVLRISDIAFRAGATTNIELVLAQRRARDADTVVTQAEDRVRQARLDLLVALGRFPQ
jgi:outer membrane protein TolC